MTASENRERNNTQMIMREFRRINAKLGQSESDLASMRVNPGDLHKFDGPHRGTHSSPPTDLGQPLLARLANDPTMGSAPAGRSLPFQGTGNLLADPTFETNYYDASTRERTFTVTGTYQNLGPNWQIKRTTSGRAATTIQAYTSPLTRIRESGYNENLSSSAWVQQYIEWVGAGVTGTTTTYIHQPVSGVGPDTTPQFKYLVASARMVVIGSGGVSSVTAWVEIEDHTGTVVATGDTVDLLSVDAEESFPLIFASVNPTYDGTTSYTMNLVVQVVSGALGGGGGYVQFLHYEPSMAFSSEAAPQSFQPAVGAWSVPVQRAVNITERFRLSGVIYDTLTATKNNYSPTGWQDCSVLMLSPNAARVITGFAAPDDAVYGTVKVIYNESRTAGQTVTLNDEDGASSANNQIRGPNIANCVIRPSAGVILMWVAGSGGNARWRVVSEI